MAYRLIAADIDRASEEIGRYLGSQSIKSTQIKKIRLGAEESLLRFMERFGDVSFSLKIGRMFGKISIPMDALAITLAVSIILDFPETAFDVFGGQCMLILGARNFGMLDIETLRDGKR